MKKQAKLSIKAFVSTFSQQVLSCTAEVRRKKNQKNKHIRVTQVPAILVMFFEVCSRGTYSLSGSGEKHHLEMLMTTTLLLPNFFVLYVVVEKLRASFPVFIAIKKKI